MKQAIEAIYENGAFRPLSGEVVAIPEGQRVRLTVDDEGDPQPLQLAMSVYVGLSDGEISEVEEIALDRGSFFGPRDGD